MVDSYSAYVCRIGRYRRIDSGGMCRRRSALLASAFLALVSVHPSAGGAVAQQAPGTSTASPRALVFRGVTVVDVEGGRRLAAQTVVVHGNRVRRVGPDGTVAVPAGARLVNARGKYLIPGLWDMHVHAWDYYSDIFHPLYVAYGVTGVRDAGTNTPLATLNRWKQEIAARTRVGPRLYVAGPSVDRCPNDARESYSSHMICVSTRDEARLVVDFLKLAGADFIKPYGLSKELYFAMLAEARRVGMPFGGHYQIDSVSFFVASDSGARFLDHYSYVAVCGGGTVGTATAASTPACADSVARLRRNNTWAVYDRSSAWRSVFPDRWIADVRRYYPPDSLAPDTGLPKYFQIIKAEHDSLFRDLPAQPRGFADFKAAFDRSATIRAEIPKYERGHSLPIVAGTDGAPVHRTIPGLALHEALVYYVLGGMTPLEALQTATLNPAKAIGATDSLGTVATGKLADLVLLDADPLKDIWNTTKIRAVVANGRYFDYAALDGLRAQAERAAHSR